MITAEQILARAVTLRGKPYIYGYEIEPLGQPYPRAADCSELVEWSCFQAGLRPFMPDGAVYQLRHCVNHDGLIDLADAFQTAGALLFSFNDDPLACRPSRAHVGFAVGDGLRSFEARGKNYGINYFPGVMTRGWTHAALIPGAFYPGW